jgi:hypothetical protein
MRLDYSNAVPSILVEPQSTNLFTYSKDFTNSIWGKDSLSIVANTISSPNGLTEGSKMVENNVNTQHRISTTINNTSGTNRSFSVIAKKGERRHIYIRGGINGNNNFIGYDLQDKTITYLYSNVTAKIKLLANDWVRISISFVSDATSSAVYIGLSTTAVTGAENVTYQGDGTSGLYLWNTQREDRSTPTSDIVTTTSAVTRNQDVITVNPPAGTVKITTTFADNTTQTLTTIPSTFTLPQGSIKQVVMQHTL